MSNSTLEETFIAEYNSTEISGNLKYGGRHIDLAHIQSVDELWTHANTHGYKEGRVIFNNEDNNTSIYDYYLNDYRVIVINADPYFDWHFYAQSYSLPMHSEYYALLDFVDRHGLDEPNITIESTLSTSLSKTNNHYTIIGEQAQYNLGEYLFHYGSNQKSTSKFGIAVPIKSKLLRAYIMYDYDSLDHYNDSDISASYDFNEAPTILGMKLYIDASYSGYYLRETLDPSHNMIIGGLRHDADVESSHTQHHHHNNNNHHHNKHHQVTIEQNSIISWECYHVKSQLDTTPNYIHEDGGNSTRSPYNPSRNRFMVVLEPL